MAQLTKQRVRRWWPVPFLIGAVLLLIGARARGWPPTITGRDLNQHRANVPAPIPNDDHVVTQTFVPTHDGLFELELIIYQNGEPIAGELTLELLDSSETLIGSMVLGGVELTLNQQVNFRFPTQLNSANTPYTLRISGRNNPNTTFWGFDLESISSGQLTVSDPAARTTAQDLRLITRYELTPQLMLRRVGALLIESALPAVMLVWIVGVMGWVVLRGLGMNRPTRDLPTNLATTFALGLCVWPLLWLWLTTLGGRWGRLSLWLFLIIATVGMMAWSVGAIRNRVLDQRESGSAERHQTSRLRVAWQHVALAILLLVGYALRLLAIRDLAFPAWVDASRHGLITAVMRDSGQFLQNYGEYLPIDQAPLYHFGYHSLMATIALLVDVQLPTLLLTTGQLLNAAVPLAIYAAAYLMTRQRTIGLCAAFIIAFPSFFPAYYVSWGRYTQLTGMIVLALLIGWCYRFTAPKLLNTTDTRHAVKVWRDLLKRNGGIFLASILGAGLFLIHFRVFLIFLPFGLLIWLLHLRRENWWQLPLVGALTLGLTLPRIVQMARYVRPQQVSGSAEGYNDFPTAYLKIGWENWFLIAGLLVVIIALLQVSQHVRWRNSLMAVGMLVFVLVGEWLGSIPAVSDTTYLRTAIVGMLLLLMIWRSTTNWMVLPIAWVIFEPFFASRSEKLILASLLFTAVWIVQMRSVKVTGRVPLLLAAAVGLLFYLLLGARVGLPQTWVLNMNSAYITLFLPLSIVLGYGLFMIGERAARSGWLTQIGIYTALGATMMLLLLYGGRRQIEMMNQGTILAEPPDVAGIAWVAENLPAEAKIAVSSWQWLGTAWAAQDGGAWLVPLTQRAATTPPADYSYERTLNREVVAFNEAARVVEDWSADSAIDFLRQHQVTHIYVGARGGFFLPDKLMQNAAIRLLFAQDGVFVFELED